jgi:hypothetical protein
MEEVNSSETFVPACKTTRRYNPEDEHCHRTRVLSSNVVPLPVILFVIQSVPNKCIHKVNIPYYNVYTSFWDTPYNCSISIIVFPLKINGLQLFESIPLFLQSWWNFPVLSHKDIQLFNIRCTVTSWWEDTGEMTGKSVKGDVWTWKWSVSNWQQEFRSAVRKECTHIMEVWR